MNLRKFLWWSIGLLVPIMLGAALWWGLNQPKPAQAQSGSHLQPVAQTLSPTQVTVAISGTELSNLGGFEFNLTANPAVARLTSAQMAGFLASTGRTVGALGPILGGQGESLAFGAYSYDPSGQNGPGPAGNGLLAVITFTIAGDGLSPLALVNPLLVDVGANVQMVTTTNAALQAKTLHGGWNLIAPCVDTTRLEVPRVLASLAGRFDMALGERGAYVAGLPPAFQSLHEIVPPWAYYVRIQGNIPVTLTQVALPFDPSTPIPLTRGWRWVGYCVGATRPITVALQSIAGSYDMVLGETGTYVVGLPDVFQTLREMRLGEGYLIRMTQDDTLVYPAGTVNVQTLERSNVSTFSCPSIQITPYLTMAYGEVYVDSGPAPAGTVVEAVTPRGEVAGCFVVQAAGRFGVMHLYGQDEDSRTPGFLPGEPVAWRVDGREATAEVGAQRAVPLIWNGDRELYHVVLTSGAAPRQPVFLPVIVR